MLSKNRFLDFRFLAVNLTEMAKNDMMPSFETKKTARFGNGGTNGISGDIIEFWTTSTIENL